MKKSTPTDIKKEKNCKSYEKSKIKKKYYFDYVIKMQ